MSKLIMSKNLKYYPRSLLTAFCGWLNDHKAASVVNSLALQPELRFFKYSIMFLSFNLLG